MNRASLVDLQAFAAVARHRNFRQAARELGVSPSALSHTLRGLESRLGVRLLNRTTRSVAPTEAGTRLLSRLNPALDELALALDEVNDFRESPAGLLRINAPRAAAEIALGPLVNRFLQRHPGMRVELVCDDAFVDIVKTGFDAGVRFGESLEQDMVAVPLGPDLRFAVVASPELLARHGAPRHPLELQQRPCIRVRFPSGSYYRWEFERGTEKFELDVDGPLALDDMKLIVEAAKAGLGFAYMYAHHAAADLTSGRLLRVLDDWFAPVPGFQLYYPSRKLMPAGLKAFVEMVQEERRACAPA
jgi:DNA-binding transcriptional LysR family regulator